MQVYLIMTTGSKNEVIVHIYVVTARVLIVDLITQCLMYESTVAGEHSANLQTT